MTLLGKNIEQRGELQNDEIIYQNQLASTVATLLDNSFEPSPKMGKAIDFSNSRTKPTDDIKHAITAKK